jgi:hypothetical protein
LLRRPLIWRCLMLTATPMFLGGGMACGHLLWLGRSTVLRHVLLACYSLCRSKNFLRREGRWLRAATLVCSGCSSRGYSNRRRRTRPGICKTLVWITM